MGKTQSYNQHVRSNFLRDEQLDIMRHELCKVGGKNFVGDEIREVVRKVLQVCASCPHGQGPGRGLVCHQYPSRCHSKRVKRWLKQLGNSL